MRHPIIITSNGEVMKRPLIRAATLEELKEFNDYLKTCPDHPLVNKWRDV